MEQTPFAAIPYNDVPFVCEIHRLRVGADGQGQLHDSCEVEKRIHVQESSARFDQRRTFCS